MSVWMNDNQGFIMALLTLVYVLATIVIMVYNHKAIKEARISRESETRPYIFGQFLIVSDYDRHIDFQLRNAGRSGAVIKKFSIDPPLKVNETSDGIDSINNLFIGPNQVFTIMLDDVVENVLDKNYSIHLVYQSVSSRKIYSETYNVPMNTFKLHGFSKLTNINNTPIENELMNISSILSSMNKRM